jgi:hypothetical protein
MDGSSVTTSAVLLLFGFSILHVAARGLLTKAAYFAEASEIV